MPRLRRGQHQEPRTAVDILYVAAGTTPGLRQADTALLRALRRCGVSTAMVRASFSPPARLRSRIYRSMVSIDVYESLSQRWATEKALRHYAPRAVMYGTTHGALFQPRRVSHRAVAIRFDTPTQLSRTGRRFAPEHSLERRRFRSARLLLPTALEVDPAVRPLLPAGPKVVPLPIPVQRGQLSHEREPIVVAYAGSAVKKRLDLVVAAWSRVATHGRRLIITGISRDEGLRFLAQHGLAEPAHTEWTGLIPADEFRALASRAEVYLSAASYENYGIAQLEALAGGALLVTTASAGPFAALPLARELAPDLVAHQPTPDALGRALQAALELPEESRVAYRERAATLVAGHSSEVLEDRLRSEVLPVLLSNGAGPAAS